MEFCRLCDLPISIATLMVPVCQARVCFAGVFGSGTFFNFQLSLLDIYPSIRYLLLQKSIRYLRFVKHAFGCAGELFRSRVWIAGDLCKWGPFE